MIENLVEWASGSNVAIWVLLGAAAIIVFEAARVSRRTFWPDAMEDED